MDLDLLGSAAHFAILDVLLAHASARVQHDRHRLSAMGTGYLGSTVGGDTIQRIGFVAEIFVHSTLGHRTAGARG